MPDIHLEHRVAIPLGLAFAALGEVLTGIATQESAWRGFALHADLGDAGLPNVGYIAVPIALTLTPATPGINQHIISIRAASHPESFPVFNGAIAADMAGPSGAMLTLGGSYEVPLGPIGTMLNAVAAKHLAERTLANFLADVAQACVARVEKRETEFMRYAAFQHAR